MISEVSATDPNVETSSAGETDPTENTLDSEELIANELFVVDKIQTGEECQSCINQNHNVCRSLY